MSTEKNGWLGTTIPIAGAARRRRRNHQIAKHISHKKAIKDLVVYKQFPFDESKQA